MTKRCAVCTNPCTFQGFFNPRWLHVDPTLDADHVALYIPPAPRACCNADA